MMKIRKARKAVKSDISRKLRRRLYRLYPTYIDERGYTVYPSWHKYQRFAKAWITIHRKIRKYGDNFRKL